MKNYFAIFVLIAVFSYISSLEELNENGKKVLRNFCGVNHLKLKMQIGKNEEVKNLSLKTRRLSSDFSPIRIFLDTTFLEIQAQELPDMQDNLPKIKRALKKAVDAMGKLIEVKQFEQNVYNYMNSTFLKSFHIDNWDEELNDPEKMSANYDYILLARFAVEADGFPPNVQAAAYPI